MKKRYLLILLPIFGFIINSSSLNTKTDANDVIAVSKLGSITSEELFNGNYSLKTHEYVFDRVYNALIDSVFVTSSEEDKSTIAKETVLSNNKQEYVTSYIKDNYVFHVSDISINLSNNTSVLYNRTISSKEAEKIYNVFNELASGENYYNVAMRYSLDVNVSSNGGDLGGVSIYDEDITEEFRHALIGYSSIVENKYSEFNITDNEYTSNLLNLYNEGMQAIPYSYIKSLNDMSLSDNTRKNYENITSHYYSSGGNVVSSSSKVYYRNIVFNSLLNSATPRFIVVSEGDVNNGANAIKMDVLMPIETERGYYTNKSKEYVLVNDEGNPYVVFTDTNGLHVTSIHKTPFANDIEEYYSFDINTSDNYISYIEANNERISELDEFANLYLNNQLKNSKTNDYSKLKIFEYYLNQENNVNGFRIVNPEIYNMIFKYIDNSLSYLNSFKQTRIDIWNYTYSSKVQLIYSDIIEKEYPLLACLAKVDGRYSCTYTYGEGFKYYGDYYNPSLIIVDSNGEIIENLNIISDTYKPYNSELNIKNITLNNSSYKIMGISEVNDYSTISNAYRFDSGNTQMNLYVFVEEV